MPVVALLDSTAELDKVFVRVDDRALHGLGGSRIVPAVVERYPAPAILVLLSNLRPGEPTSHPFVAVKRSFLHH